jgi:hypothetical protein
MGRGHQVPKSDSSTAQPFGEPDHFGDFIAVVRRKNHIKRERKFLKNTDAGRPHHAPVRAFAAQAVMGLFARAIQAERNSEKPAAVIFQQGINLRKCCSIADKTKVITGFGNMTDDLAKAPMDGWLATRKTQLLDATVFAFAKHLVQDFQRQIARSGMPLVKTVAAAQITIVRQLNDNAGQEVSPCASANNSMSFAGRRYKSIPASSRYSSH